MNFLTSRWNVKKGVWLSSMIGALLLSIAVCLFQNNNASTFREPAFWQFVICCVAFFGAAACTVTLSSPWFSFAATVCGAALVAIFAQSLTVLFFAVLLPGLLWLLLLRYFSNKERQKLFLPLSCGLSALLLAAIVFLLIKLPFADGLFSFFRPSYNNTLKDFWLLVFFFVLFAIFFYSMQRQNTEKKQAANKKKRGKTTVSSPDHFLVLSAVLTLLFFTDTALVHIFYWYSNEGFAPYALLIDFCCLFLLLGLFAFPAATERQTGVTGR